MWLTIVESETSYALANLAVESQLQSTTWNIPLFLFYMCRYGQCGLRNQVLNKQSPEIGRKLLEQSPIPHQNNDREFAYQFDEMSRCFSNLPLQALNQIRQLVDCIQT